MDDVKMAYEDLGFADIFRIQYNILYNRYFINLILIYISLDCRLPRLKLCHKV